MSSKLHLPNKTNTGPLCGRQLNNHRGAKAQNASNAAIATSVEHFIGALDKNKACRHCARAFGLLPALTRQTPDQDDLDV